MTTDHTSGDPGDSLALAHDLPPCHSRREYNADQEAYFCAHPLVHVAGDLVTKEVCRHCRRWQDPPPERFRAFPSGTGREVKVACLHLGEQTGFRHCPSCGGNVRLKVFACHHPEHGSTTLNECRFCLDYEPLLSAKAVRNWSVGVTTAPRAKPTLDRCLTSLSDAGWTEARVFAEPKTPISRLASRQTIVWRTLRAGEWPNWILAINELYQREPLADAYLMVQDDATFCRGLRAYLEERLWPQTRLAYVALYNPLAFEVAGPGFEVLPKGTLLPGAVALVFPNFAARMLLGDSQVLLHRRNNLAGGLTATDAVISHWAKRRGLAELVHIPSLAQHIGVTTTVGSAEQDQHTRQSGSFVGETFDARSWLDA